MNEWVWNFRKQASLLLAEGHTHAWQYPLGMLSDEAGIVSGRENRRLAQAAELIHAAISTQPVDYSKQGADRANKAGKLFRDRLKNMLGI